MRVVLATLAIWGALGSAALAQPSRPIRIGVVESTNAATLSMTVPFGLWDGPRDLAHFAALAPVGCAIASGAIAVTGPDGFSWTATGSLRWVPESASPETRSLVGSKRYRGTLEVRSASTSLAVIDEVGLEEYLYGVVPCESIPSWGLDALKAQAVAARTYAIAHLGQFAKLGYDLKATVESQVYGGAASEKASTNRAVDETADEIMVYDGKPIDALYSDCTGGYTESCADAWGRPVPYLQSVPDFDQDSPRYVWEVTATPDKVRLALQKLNARIGDLASIEPLERSNAGRLKKVRLVGSDGTLEISGEKLRFALGLRSTCFNVARQEDGSYLFCGRGWGHGVGMSQWGAKGLSDMGYRYDQILMHFYAGSTLSHWGDLGGTQARPKVSSR